MSLSFPHAAQAGEAFACSPSTRRLPIVLAAAAVVAAAIAAMRVDPHGVLPNAAWVRGLLVAAGVVVGVRIVLSLAELPLRVTVRESDLLLVRRKRTFALSYEDLGALDYDPAFRHYSMWPPALVLVDRRGRRVRVPAIVEGGERLIRLLVERAGRRDLEDWAAAGGMERRMRRSRWFVPVGYLAALALVVCAALSGLR